MDWDRFTSDDPLGDATVSLHALRTKPEQEFAVPLTKGTIFLEVKWSPPGSTISQAVQQPADTAGPSSHTSASASECASVAQQQPAAALAAAASAPTAEASVVHEVPNGPGILRVRIDKAKNLLSADSNGLSDPYVIVKLGSETKKTAVKYKTLNPVWGEMIEFEGLTIEDARTRGLTFRVMDKDTFSKDDPLGDLMVNLLEEPPHALLVNPPRLREEALPTKGVITFSVMFLPGL